MADNHFPQTPSPLQVVKSEPARDVIVSRGAEHPADGLLGYLREASPSGLSNMFVANAGELADRRRQLLEVLGAWIDAAAIEKFLAWQCRQPRKVNGNGSKPAAQREPVPDDVTPLDPFFRPHAQAAAIRREMLKPYQLKKWVRHFEKFGCLGCGTRENYQACGFCGCCHCRIRARLQSIEADLRLEAAREPNSTAPR